MGLVKKMVVPQSHRSILIVEDDSRVSRILRHSLESVLKDIRVEIAGSASKARVICEKFPPTLIIWDGTPNERGTEEEYFQCVPDKLWSKVIPISVGESVLAAAKTKGALPAVPKKIDAINTWADECSAAVKSLLTKTKK